MYHCLIKHITHACCRIKAHKQEWDLRYIPFNFLLFTPIIIFLNKISSTFILLSEDILSVLIVRITHFSTFKFVNLFSSKSILIIQFL